MKEEEIFRSYAEATVKQNALDGESSLAEVCYGDNGKINRAFYIPSNEVSVELLLELVQQCNVYTLQGISRKEAEKKSKEKYGKNLDLYTPGPRLGCLKLLVESMTRLILDFDFKEKLLNYSDLSVEEVKSYAEQYSENIVKKVSEKLGGILGTISFTGNGLHIELRLEKALKATNKLKRTIYLLVVKELEALLEGEVKFDVACANPSQPFRLPCSKNYKKERGERQGYILYHQPDNYADDFIKSLIPNMKESKKETKVQEQIETSNIRENLSLVDVLEHYNYVKHPFDPISEKFFIRSIVNVDKTPSFCINVADSTFNDFSAGIKGDVFDLIKLFEEIYNNNKLDFDSLVSLAEVILKSKDRDTDGHRLFIQSPSSGYFVVENFKTYFQKDLESPLKQVMNGVLRIDEERHYQNHEDRRVFVVRAVNSRGVHVGTVEVPCEDFGKLPQKLSSYFGSEISHTPDRDIPMRLPWVILNMSCPRKRMVYSMTGMNKISGQTTFLTNSSCITKEGVNSDLIVEVKDAGLEDIQLPIPSTEIEEKREIGKAVSKMTKLVKERELYTLLAFTFIAPMDIFFRHDLIGMICGETGSLKTSIASVMQSFFGKNFNDRNILEAWTSTDNSIIHRLNYAKSILVLIDDYVNDTFGRNSKKLENIIRATSNQKGKGRLTKDIKMREVNSPKSFVLATTEVIPGVVASALARTWILPLDRDEVCIDTLTELQQYGEEGVLAQFMSNFIQYVICNEESLRKEFKELSSSLRKELLDYEVHKRSPDNFSKLYFTNKVFFRYLKVLNVISENDFEMHVSNSYSSLITLTRYQSSLQRDSDPTLIFLDLLSQLLHSGEAHLKNNIGKPFDEASAMGRTTRTQTPDLRTEFSPSGDCVGWTDNDYIYLYPSKTFSLVRRLNSSVDGIPLPEKLIKAALLKQGWLEQGSELGRSTTKIKVPESFEALKLKNPRPRLLKLKKAKFMELHLKMSPEAP